MTYQTRRKLLQRGGAAAAALAFTGAPNHARAAEFTYKFGNTLPPAHPVNVAAKKAAERILEETKGRLEIRVFPSSQLGADTDMLSQVRSGALEFYSQSGLVLANMVPAAGINGIGFAFKDYDVVWSAMDGDLGTFVRAEIEKVGLLPMQKMWDNGFRQITASSKAINSPADLGGFKIRVPVSPIWVSLFKALGAAPASLNFSELYTALQTKIVDGQENPLTLLEFGEVLRGAEVLLDHQPHVGRLLVPGQPPRLGQAAPGRARGRRAQPRRRGPRAARDAGRAGQDRARQAREFRHGLQHPGFRDIPRRAEQERLLRRMEVEVRR